VPSVWVFDPDVIPSGILVTFATGFPVSMAGNVRWEVVEGSSDDKSKLF
jgi:hypothetical protein